MSDIAIEFRVKNKRLKDAIFKAGWRSYAHFATTNQIAYTQLNDLLGMRKKACNKTGWRKTSIAIATALHCEPEDLWPNEMAHAALITNNGEFSISLENAMSLIPSARINRLALGHLLEGISLRDAKVLTAVARGETYDEVGEHIQVTRERARQIHLNALKRLQDRARFRGIKYTDIVEEP